MDNEDADDEVSSLMIHTKVSKDTQNGCFAVRRQLLEMPSNETSPVIVLGSNFSAGFIAGCLVGASTCPLDVSKTRRQIELRLAEESCKNAVTRGKELEKHEYTF